MAGESLKCAVSAKYTPDFKHLLWESKQKCLLANFILITYKNNKDMLAMDYYLFVGLEKGYVRIHS